MKNLIKKYKLAIVLLTAASLYFFCPTEKAAAQNARQVLGVKLRPEIVTVVDEIESKTDRKIYAELSDFDGEGEEFMIGSSFISEDGVAVVRARRNLRTQAKMLEAVIGHELFHLRLRVNGYPVFLFSPTVKTRRGLAQDTEQNLVNDLQSLIEHRIFKAEMDKLGFLQVIMTDEDTIRTAEKNAGREDGQADAINFARAILEYKNAQNVARLRQIYVSNKWTKSIAIGEEIARQISQPNINSPAAVEAVFKRCLAKLYPAPRLPKLTRDTTVKTYRLMMISY